MTVSPEIEELVKHAMRVGDYASENEVLLAALRALNERRQTAEMIRRRPSDCVSSLGMQLREIRAQYLAGGGNVLSPEEFDHEMAQRRGDALHIAAAKRAACDEFVTAEKPTKPLFRVAGIQVTTIRPQT